MFFNELKYFITNYTVFITNYTILKFCMKKLKIFVMLLIKGYAYHFIMVAINRSKKASLHWLFLCLKFILLLLKNIVTSYCFS